MQKFRAFQAAMVVAGVSAFASTALAQSTETFTATATVSSSVTITENTPLSFGTLVVVHDGTNAPAAILNPDSTYAPNRTGTESLVQIGTPSAGSFTVDVGVPAYINVQVEFPDSAVTLRNTVAPPSNGTFAVDTFTIGTLSAGNFSGTTTSATACIAAILASNPCQFTTANSGLVTFPVGASIAASSAVATFIDGVYQGDFDLTASFF